MLVVAASILGCGDEDVIDYDDLTTKVYTSARGVGVINLKSSYPGYKPSTMEIVAQPESGIVRRFDDYIRYYPSPGGTPRADRFTIKLKGDTSTAMIEAVVIPSTAASCDQEPLTNFTISRGTTVSVDLYWNKDFCNFDPSASATTGVCIRGETNNDIVTTSIAAFETHRIFTFSAQQDFVGTYSLEYALFVARPNPPGDLCTDPTSSTYYSKHVITVEVN